MIACAGLFLVPCAILIGAAYTQVGYVRVIPPGPRAEVALRQGNVTYFYDANNPAELVDLPTAVEDAIDLISPAAKASQIQIGTALQDAQVTGDRVLLERLVSNLIDNAVKHNVTGGWVRASTKTGTGIAEITVSNGGEHIPPDQVPGLFEPFRRLSGRTSNQPGSGLGLSIVASVARAHSGHAKAYARPDGGLDVQITLPATTNERRPAPRQPQTAAPQILQPDHRIPLAADKGHATAE